jgi:pectate lyase
LEVKELYPRLAADLRRILALAMVDKMLSTMLTGSFFYFTFTCHKLILRRCTNGNAGSGATSITVKYDKAGVSSIDLGSNKSLIGIGSKGVIRGKGLRVANGAKNVIIQ